MNKKNPNISERTDHLNWNKFTMELGQEYDSLPKFSKDDLKERMLAVNILSSKTKHFS